jgi:chromosome segregation ATPase
MTLPRPLRRSLVIVGVIASLAAGIVTAESAAEWTARSAPLAVAPESVQSLTARLAAEEARSTALQDELDALRTRATELSDALDVARGRIVSDSDTAAALRARLDGAKTRLVALEKLIAAARAKVRTATAAAPSRTSPAGGWETSEHEDGDD